jgi:SAM-dependent methyltransferase
MNPVNPHELVESTCPLCGSGKRKLRLRLGPAWVAACKACRFRYAFPRLPEDQLAISYVENPSDLPPNRDAMLKRLMQARANQILVEAWPCCGKRWLELGCGFGHCLAAIRAAGFEVEGTELAREQIRHAREKLGLPVHSCDITSESWPQPSSTFDVIASFEVIEHLSEPLAFLRGIFKRLNPGGQIMLSTPNYSSLYRRLLGRHWYYHIPTGISFGHRWPMNASD